MFLTRTIDEFKSFFHSLFLIQIIVSGIFICTSTYVLAFTVKLSFESYWHFNSLNSFQSTTANVIETLSYVACFIHGVSDIYLVMYLANEIRLASDKLSYRLFESNWIEQSRTCRKCVIILAEFLKQPQEMVIFKLYPMNLETFTLVSLP